MKKKILIILLILIVVSAGLYFYNLYRKDPNILYKKTTTRIDLNEPEDVTFNYDAKMFTGRQTIPVFVFTPEQDGSYAFTISDIETSEKIYMTMSVCDKNLNDYIVTDNYSDHAEFLSGSEYFNAGTKCLIIIDAVSAEELDRYKGSFRLEVTRSTEDLSPEALTLSSPVSVTVANNDKTSALFVPETDGFYMFSAKILSNKNNSGYADIESIKDENDKAIKQKGGICWLEGGKEYYVWISASELTTAKAVAKVNVDSMETIEAAESGRYDINKAAVILFTPKENKNYVVYSESDGKTLGAVYDKKGFQLNYDEDSGGPLSGNKNDFAYILQAEKDELYYLFAAGDFSKCSIVITEYTGDGSSLEKKDIAPLPEEENVSSDKKNKKNIEEKEEDTEENDNNNE